MAGKKHKVESSNDPQINLEFYPTQMSMLTTEGNEILFGGAKGGGKLMCLKTPILTMNRGWQTMGDLVVNDMVFDEKGQPTKVVWKSEVESERTFRITFDAYTTIIAGENHEWLTLTQDERNTNYKRSPEYRAKRRAQRAENRSEPMTYHGRVVAEMNAAREQEVLERIKPSKRTTLEMFETQKNRTGGANHTIVKAKPLRYPGWNDLPIPPYVLGAWLGDGSKNSGGFTSVDLPVIEKIRSLGYEVTDGKEEKAWYIKGLVGQLKEIGVFENKHIPRKYMTASFEQRLELARGLMDADGHVQKNGKFEMSLSHPKLGMDFFELLISLGIKVNVRERESFLYGEKKNNRFRMTFYSDLQIVTLPRHVERWKTSIRDEASGSQRRNNWYITNIEEIDPVPMQCIQVDAPSHMYLAGEHLIPTHNSFALRWAAFLYGLSVEGLEIYFFRRKYADLKSNHIFGPEGYLSIADPYIKAGKVSFNHTDNRLDFFHDGGKTSRIFLRHIQHDKDMENYRGIEAHVIVFDELSHFPSTVYNFIRTHSRLGSLKIDYKKVRQSLPFVYDGYFPRIISGTNPGGVGHCLEFGDVLTPNKGWVDISTMRPGDQVYTVASDGTLIESVVDQFHEYDVDTELVEFNGTGRMNGGLYISATNEHKVAYIPNSKRPELGYRLKPIKDLPGQTSILRTVKWVGYNDEYLTLPPYEPERVLRRRTKQPLSLPMKVFAELYGWFVSEGFFEHENRRLIIAQEKPDSRAELERFLREDCGFEFRGGPSQVSISGIEWYNYFASLNLGNSEERYIPKFLKDATVEVLEAMLKTMVLGDGRWVEPNKRGTYYTASKQLADDVAEVALKLGYMVNVTSRERDSYEYHKKDGTTVVFNRNHTSYEIRFRKTKSGATEVNTGNHVYDVATTKKRKSDVRYVPYKGKVYCIGVPDTHTFIVRQRGSVWVSGNSWIKREFIDSAPPNTVWKTPPEKGGMNRIYIPSKVTDNIKLMENDPGYIDRIRGMGGPMVKAFLEGDWNIIDGGAVSDIWDETVHVIPQIIVPKDASIFRALDWGTFHPSVVIYALQSTGETIRFVNGDEMVFPKGSLIIFHEIYNWDGEDENAGNRKPATEVGMQMAAFEAEVPWRDSIRPGPADRQIFQMRGGTHDTIDRLLCDGYNTYMAARATKDSSFNWRYNTNTLFEQADQSTGSRITGLSLVRDFLQASVDFMNTGEDRKALFFAENVRHCISTIPDLPRSETNPEDTETNHVPDHAYDAVRYLCLAQSGTFTPLSLKGL